MMDSGVCGEAAGLLTIGFRLGQASDLISECLRLTNCRPDGVGRPALGK